jgi:hypothetical protein
MFSNCGTFQLAWSPASRFQSSEDASSLTRHFSDLWTATVTHHPFKESAAVKNGSSFD